MPEQTDPLTKLVYTLMHDENGISEEAYRALIVYLGWVDSELSQRLLALVQSCDATDGRFYWKDD